MSNSQPVPRPPSSVKHCAACGTAIVRPPRHCKSKACTWWRCPAVDCDRQMNDDHGHAVPWVA